MSIIEEIRTMLTYLFAFAIGVVSCFFRTYFRERAKNLATREDIGQITKEIENVKAQYSESLQNIIHQNNLLLEEVRGQHQLRMAALDRRLQAHQEAFTLWKKLLLNVFREEISDVVDECQNWWDKNCLYLSSDARLAFKDAYQSASIYKELKRDRSKEENREEYKLIQDAGQAIVIGAELPSLGEKEYSFVKHEKAKSSTSEL